MAKNVSFPCQRATYNKVTVYVLLCKAKELRDIVRVNRRVEDKDEGYQRSFSVSRAKDIGRYISDGGVIPGSVIVTFDKAAFNETKMTLNIPHSPDAGWVIDGQHRLEGAAIYAREDVYLPVTAFVGLPEEQQIELFVTINKEQKGVSSSLYLDLIKKLPGRLTEQQALQERAADLAEVLKKDPDSAFFRKIVSTAAPKTGQLSLTNFARKVVPLIRPNAPLSSYPDEDRAKILSNLFTALSELFPKHKEIFYKTLGFGAILNAFPTIHQVVLSNRGPDFTVVSFQQIFRSIDYFDFGGWKDAGTGSAAEIAAGRDLGENILRSNPIKLKL